METPTGRPVARRIIAVGGGKGGVGKSVVTSNLAIAIASQGRQVTVIDADLGGANQHTLLGISRPDGGIQAFLDGDVSSLAEAAVRTSTYGVKLVAGSSHVGVANLSHRQKQRLLSAVLALDTDVILIDLGAGTTLNTIDFVDLADIRLVVMTPQLTSLQNAYAFLKAAVHRSIQLAGRNGEEREVFASAVAKVGDAQRMSALIAALSATSVPLGIRCASLLASYGVMLVGNMVHEPAEARTFERMSRMIHDFLGVPAPIAACLHDSASVRESVNRRRPLLEDGGGVNSVELRRLAQVVLRVDVPRLRTERSGTYEAELAVAS